MIEEHAAGWPSAVTDDVRPEAGPPPLTPEEIRERMSGNLCRCGAYVSIVQAVARAAGAPTTQPAQAVPAAADNSGADNATAGKEAAA
jgi:xanthine dehydrogenase YagT iron-sulfur-binding subunit